MDEKKIARINQLAAKAKTPEGLTQEEREEQLRLRREYIDSVVGNLARELDNTYVVDEHGNKRKLRRNFFHIGLPPVVSISASASFPKILLRF